MKKSPRQKMPEFTTASFHIIWQNYNGRSPKRAGGIIQKLGKSKITALEELIT